jgi:serine/threonine protein kinase
VQNEVASLHMLDHPNIVKLFDAFEDDDSFHLIMELCSGGDLASKMHHNGKPFEEKIVIKIMH